jgi:hypothetical protein
MDKLKKTEHQLLANLLIEGSAFGQPLYQIHSRLSRPREPRTYMQKQRITHMQSAPRNPLEGAHDLAVMCKQLNETVFPVHNNNGFITEIDWRCRSSRHEGSGAI